MTPKRLTDTTWLKYSHRLGKVSHGAETKRKKRRTTYRVQCHFCSYTIISVRQRCVDHLKQIHAWNEKKDTFPPNINVEDSLGEDSLNQTSDAPSFESLGQDTSFDELTQESSLNKLPNFFSNSNDDNHHPLHLSINEPMDVNQIYDDGHMEWTSELDLDEICRPLVMDFGW